MIKPITGTKDILPVDIHKWNYLESIVKAIGAEYNYKEIIKYINATAQVI